MRQLWRVLNDSNDEQGNPTCWYLKIDHPKYGKYLWISAKGIGYAVEFLSYDTVCVLKMCKSLASAKRWVTMNVAK